MRTALVLAGLALTLAAPVQAAPKFASPLAQIFERVCLNNRPDFDKAIEGLEAAGYVETTTPDDALKAIRKFETQIGDTAWAIQIADRVRPDQAAGKAQRIRACTTIGVDPEDKAKDELRTWLALPPPEGDKTIGAVFVERDGKRQLITVNPADTGPALEQGGFYTLGVVDTGAGTMAMLLFSSPAP